MPHQVPPFGWANLGDKVCRARGTQGFLTAYPGLKAGAITLRRAERDWGASLSVVSLR